MIIHNRLTRRFLEERGQIRLRNAKLVRDQANAQHVLVVPFAHDSFDRVEHPAALIAASFFP